MTMPRLATASMGFLLLSAVLAVFAAIATAERVDFLHNPRFEDAKFIYTQTELRRGVDRDARGVIDSGYDDVEVICACVGSEISACERLHGTDGWDDFASSGDFYPLCMEADRTKAEFRIGDTFKVRDLSGFEWEMGPWTLYRSKSGWAAQGVNVLIESVWSLAVRWTLAALSLFLAGWFAARGQSNT